MIIDKSNSEVIGVATTDFKIVASSKAFKILGDSLYLNKQEAVIRELSTNALDAQKEANTDKRYYIHIPTNLDTEFKVRDFGTGLDAEQIEGLYTTYFQSTKDESNDYIGALGLGSKSPFSCTKEFTVTSYKNGIMYVYLIKSINDIPTFSKLIEVPTDQPNGLEIKFDTEDVYNFNRAYQKVISAFDDDKKPESNVELDYEISEIIKGVYKTTNPQHGSISVRMGQILYPINEPDNYIDNNVFNNFSNKIIIDVPLGSVDIQPSRESLDFSEKTETFLTNYLKCVQDELLKSIKNQVKECDDIRHAAKLINQLGFPKNMFTYKGKEIIDFYAIYEKCNKLAYKNSVGYITSKRARDLVSPRMKYFTSIRSGIFSKVVLLINTKKINLAHTLKYLAYKHTDCDILYVASDNHTLIGSLKKVYKDDLYMYTTCDTHLRKNIQQFKVKEKIDNSLVKIIEVKKVDSNVRMYENSINKEDVCDIEKAFSGSKRGNYITVADNGYSFTVEVSRYYYNREILKIMHNIYGDFTIVLGVNNKKLINCLAGEFFEFLKSGKCTTLTDKEIKCWKYVGFDYGDKISINRAIYDTDGLRIDVELNCDYIKAQKNNKLIYHVIDNLKSETNEKTESILDELKELL